MKVLLVVTGVVSEVSTISFCKYIEMLIPIYLLHGLEHIIHMNPHAQKPSKTKKISHTNKKVRICLKPEYILYTNTYYPPDTDTKED